MANLTHSRGRSLEDSAFQGGALERGAGPVAISEKCPILNSQTEMDLEVVQGREISRTSSS